LLRSGRPALDLADKIRLRQLATDAGFDLVDPDLESGWLRLRASHARLVLWLRPAAPGAAVHPDPPTDAERGIEIGLSRLDVAAALRDAWPNRSIAPVDGACGDTGQAGMRAALRAADRAEARALLRRAFQLARALPTQPLERFQSAIAGYPTGGTEIERLAIQRVGQSLFRDALLDFWNGRCAVTGLDMPELLRASHARPWADCDSDADRLDVCNGLLLAAHLDAAFDGGLIAVAADGSVMPSARLTQAARTMLGLAAPRRIAGLLPRHEVFLSWHRARIWTG
jgi:putative restriction endonuclease